MSKVKTSFFCQNCGYESVKWVGQCPSCGQWNTFVEELIQKDAGKKHNGWQDYHDEIKTNRSVTLNDIKSSEEKRILTADDELNRVLGGGVSLEVLYWLRESLASGSLPCSCKMDCG